MKTIFMCASFGQLLHSSWEIPVLFSVITIVTGVQMHDNSCDLTKTDVDWVCEKGYILEKLKGNA